MADSETFSHVELRFGQLPGPLKSPAGFKYCAQVRASISALPKTHPETSKTASGMEWNKVFCDTSVEMRECYTLLYTPILT